MLVKELGEEELRMSMRAPNSIRSIQINQFGSLLAVRSGNNPQDSCVYFSFSKTKTAPFSDKPAEGIFQILLERGKKNDLLLNMLHSVFVKSKCINMTDLCLQTSKEVYAINITVYPIQVNGDLYRLCVEGVKRILKELGVKTSFQPRVFQYASVGKRVMADPDGDELEASRWSMVVVMKSMREILLFESVGGEAGAEEVIRSVEEAMKEAMKMVNN